MCSRRKDRPVPCCEIHVFLGAAAPCRHVAPSAPAAKYRSLHRHSPDRRRRHGCPRRTLEFAYRPSIGMCDDPARLRPHRHHARRQGRPQVECEICRVVGANGPACRSSSTASTKKASRRRCSTSRPRPATCPTHRGDAAKTIAPWELGSWILEISPASTR